MTKEFSPDVDLTLQQADESRRGFLSKLITGGATVAAIPIMSSAALAQGGPGKGRGRAGGAKGQGGGGRGQGNRPDPAQIAAMLIKQYDRDGDGALNQQELAAALKGMRERMAGGRQGRGGPGGQGGFGGKGGGRGGPR